MGDSGSKTHSSKPHHSKKERLVILSVVALAFALLNGIGFGFASYYNNKPATLSLEDQKKDELNKQHIEKLIKINELCENLFTDSYINDNVSDEDFTACYNAGLDLGADNNSIFSNKILSEAKSYREYREKIVDTISNFNSADFDSISGFSSETQKEISTFNKSYQERLSTLSEELNNKVQRVEDAKSRVDGLFTGDNVSENINRGNYNDVRSFVDSIERDDVKSELYTKLDKVESVIAERERIAWEKAEAERLAREAAERERQERIANAWHYINVPNYISQNRNNVFNGCEAASLLMALQSKGYLTGKSLRDYATEMPKSNDPATGFYLDIFGVEPRDVSHWIDTAPLADFGRNSSGADIVDLHGSGLDAVANELINGNPVVIWLTYDFKQPYNWNDSSKMYKNLHVQLVTGYNTETRQFRITDPWTRNNGDYTFYLDWGKIESIYNTIGQRAVAVRSNNSNISLAVKKKLSRAKPAFNELIDKLIRFNPNLEGFDKD